MICKVKETDLGNIYCLGDTLFKCLRCKLRRFKLRIE